MSGEGGASTPCPLPVRPLGVTGLRVPVLGLGTVTLGRAKGLKLARPAAMPDDATALALLAAARDEGVTLIDTAPAYGVSESRLGVLLPRVAPRGAWTIVTKCGEHFEPGPGGGGAGGASAGGSRYDFSPASLRASLHASLAALRVEHVDVLLLHFSSADETDAAVLARGEAMAELSRLRDAGLVRAVGASIGTRAGAEAALADERCQVLMMTLNLADERFGPLVARAAAQGRGVLVKKPLASGHAEAGASLARVLSTPGVSSAVTGTGRVEHLRENARVARGAGAA